MVGPNDDPGTQALLAGLATVASELRRTKAVIGVGAAAIAGALLMAPVVDNARRSTENCAEAIAHAEERSVLVASVEQLWDGLADLDMDLDERRSRFDEFRLPPSGRGDEEPVSFAVLRWVAVVDQHPGCFTVEQRATAQAWRDRLTG